MIVNIDDRENREREARKALERFVAENDDLLALELRIGRFNIFDALGITRAEIRHSNFLSFILDPAESHGLSQLFLKAILIDLLKNASPDTVPLSPIDVDGSELRGIEVKREWKNLDLLITCKDPAFGVVIENKVDSTEHSDQLRRYQETMKTHYLNLRCLYVFLTPDSHAPSENSWLPYSYCDIHRVLKRVRITYENVIGDDVLVFLDHYLNLLETRFMNDEKLDELCRKIYKNHRQALELIWERAGNFESSVFLYLTNALMADLQWHVFSQSRKYIEFVPTAWLDWLPKIGAGENPQYWVFANIRVREDRLVFTMFVGPLIAATNRQQIVTTLREVCPNLRF